MGCDIHGVFQTQIDGKWVDVPHALRLDRNYGLFGDLAGVRYPPKNVLPVAEGRGLPEDFEIDIGCRHPTTPECLDVHDRWMWMRYYRDEGRPCAEWMGDHSFSWATGKEMLDWFRAAPDDVDANGHVGYFFDEVERLMNQHSGVLRFVFGFDN